MLIPVDVKSRFDRSQALTAHIERRLGTALRPHARFIRSVDLRLSDVNGPRGGEADKVTRIAIDLVPSGKVVATASAGDIYLSVSRAVDRAKSAVGRHAVRFKQALARRRRQAERV